MIAANKAVGRFFHARSLPDRYGAIHRRPIGPRRQARRAARRLREPDRRQAAAAPLGLKQVLDQISGEAQRVGAVVPRAAHADAGGLGHRARRPLGLASATTSASSPIGALPDLLVHRLLKYHLHRDGHPSGGGPAKPPPAIEALTALCARSARRVRRAMEAEREAVAMYRAYLMRDQVGQRFEGWSRR